MLRFFPIVFVLLVACQSTARRGENRQDKTTGPQFDDNEVPDSAQTTQPVKKPISGNQKPKEAERQRETDSSSSTVVITEKKLEDNPNLPFGPLTMTGGETSWIISRDQYVISWNPNTRNPNWVSWKLTLSDLGSIGRQGNFTIDPDLKSYVTTNSSSVKTVATTDYTGSCFDRGHMVASSDRQGSQEDNIPTFHMTNVIPQTAFHNQRIWKGLEDQAKAWLEEGTHKNLWIVSGPVYEETKHFMGPDNSIAIPSAAFKLVYSWDEYSQDKPFLLKAILVPNMTSKGTLAYEDRERLCAESKSGGKVKGEPVLKSVDFEDYQATVPEIEAAAHIRLPELVP